MPSMFGAQFNSMRPSPQGYLFTAAVTKRKPRDWVFQSQSAIPPTLGPGPLAASSNPHSGFGLQVKSTERSYPIASLGMTDDRWAFMEYKMKTVKTPGPGNYNPN